MRTALAGSNNNKGVSLPMSVRKTLPLVAGTILIAAATLSAQEPSAPAPLRPERPANVEGFRRERPRRDLKVRRRLFAENRRDTLRQLNLTEEQQKQRFAIRQQHREELRAQREQLFALRSKTREGNLTDADRAKAQTLRQELRASRQQMRTEMRNVLTNEQRTRFDQLREQRKQRRDEMLLRRQQLRLTKP